MTLSLCQQPTAGHLHVIIMKATALPPPKSDAPGGLGNDFLLSTFQFVLLSVLIFVPYLNSLLALRPGIVNGKKTLRSRTQWDSIRGLGLTEFERPQNVVRTSATHSAIALCTTCLLLLHFDVICDQLLNRRAATFNLLLFNIHQHVQTLSTSVVLLPEFIP